MPAAKEVGSPARGSPKGPVAASSADMDMAALQKELGELKDRMATEQRDHEEAVEEVRAEERAKAARQVTDAEERVRSELLQLQDIEHVDAMRRQDEEEKLKGRRATAKAMRSCVRCQCSRQPSPAPAPAPAGSSPAHSRRGPVRERCRLSVFILGASRRRLEEKELKAQNERAEAVAAKHRMIEEMVEHKRLVEEKARIELEMQRVAPPKHRMIEEMVEHKRLVEEKARIELEMQRAAWEQREAELQASIKKVEQEKSAHLSMHLEENLRLLNESDVCVETMSKRLEALQRCVTQFVGRVDRQIQGGASERGDDVDDDAQEIGLDTAELRACVDQTRVFEQQLSQFAATKKQELRAAQRKIDDCMHALQLATESQKLDLDAEKAKHAAEQAEMQLKTQQAERKATHAHAAEMALRFQEHEKVVAQKNAEIAKLRKQHEEDLGGHVEEHETEKSQLKEEHETALEELRKQSAAEQEAVSEQNAADQAAHAAAATLQAELHDGEKAALLKAHEEHKMELHENHTARVQESDKELQSHREAADEAAQAAKEAVELLQAEHGEALAERQQAHEAHAAERQQAHEARAAELTQERQEQERQHAAALAALQQETSQTLASERCAKRLFAPC